MLPLLAPTVFLGALLAAGPLPSPAHVTTNAIAANEANASDVQIFRLILRGTDASASVQNLDLVVNRDADVLKGYMIATRSSVTLDAVTIMGDMLRATVPTDHGTGELVLQGTSGVLRGTFTVNGKTLTVTGERIL